MHGLKPPEAAERGGIARLWLVKIQGEIHLLSQGSRLSRHLIPSWLALVELLLLMVIKVTAATHPRRLASQPRGVVVAAEVTPMSWVVKVDLVVRPVVQVEADLVPTQQLRLRGIRVG